jgi:hypothetical protein
MEYEQKKNRTAGGILLLVVLSMLLYAAFGQSLSAYSRSLTSYGQSLISSAGSTSVATKVAPKKLTLEEQLLRAGYTKSVCKDGTVCWCKPAAKKPAPKVVAPKPQPKKPVARKTVVHKVVKRVRKVPAPLPVIPAVATPVARPVVVPLPAPAPLATAPAMRAVPVYERREVEVVEHSAAELELEAIAGVWGWKSKSASGQGAYGEFAVKFDIGNGQKLGVGALGMIGSGHSRGGDYRWRERRFGPQVTWGHSYMKTHTDKDGNVMELPAYDGVKARLLWDQVKGENPTSGYHMKQNALCGNIYAEHLERTSVKQMWGVTGDALLCGKGKIRSSWAGDKPQNRGMIQVAGFGQTQLDNHLAVRYGLKGTHQMWDGANYLSPFAELRLDETFMCGGQYNFGLNHVAGNSVLGFCRAELGGEIRSWDKKRRVKRVELVRTGVRYEPTIETTAVTTDVVSAPTLANDDAISAELPSITSVAPVANDNGASATLDMDLQGLAVGE